MTNKMKTSEDKKLKRRLLSFMADIQSRQKDNALRAEEIRKDVEETRKNIRKGVRRSSSRFSL